MTAEPASPKSAVASFRHALSSRGSDASSVSFQNNAEDRTQEGDAQPVIPRLQPIGRSGGERAKSWKAAGSNMQSIVTTEREQRQETELQARRKPRKAGLDTGRCKKPVKQQVADLMDRLTQLMAAEWLQIVKMAPSLKSGTGVVEEVLLRKLHVIIKKLNVLCVTRPEAAEHMIVKANQLDRERVQLLMKMFDALDYPLLTDYVRTCINHSSKLRPVQATEADLAQISRQRSAVTASSNPTKTPSPITAGSPAPGPQEFMIFTKPAVKSDFPDRSAHGHAKADKQKGWASSGLSREVRKRNQGLKEPEADARHQLVSGWNTGAAGMSSLFIDPVSGHNHAPVFAPYDSDEEDGAREQIQRLTELKVKLAEAEKEENERIARLQEERARLLDGDTPSRASLQSRSSLISSSDVSSP